MKVMLKKGSELKVDVPQGVSLKSSDASVLGVAIMSGIATVKANAAGNTILTAAIADGLALSVPVEVTT